MHWCMQAHLLVAAAQQRAELVQNTAALEAKIIVADREVQGLHAACMRLGGANQALIQSFKCAPWNSRS